MRATETPVTWVVYRMTIRGKVAGVNAVCDRREWDAIEQAQPGHHTLVQAGITSEGEAERIARTVPAESIAGRAPESAGAHG